MSLVINPGRSVESIDGNIAGGFEQSYATCSAESGQFDIQTFTFDAFANINQGEFFVLENVAGTTYGVWFDLDADGTAPTGAAFAAVDTEIEVDIATGNDAATVAAAVELALAATANITFDDTAADGTMTATQDVLGAPAASVFYDNDSTAYSGGGALAVAATQAGAASDLDSKFFSFASPSGAFYCWFDPESEGSDPSESGTAIEVDVSANSSASVVATAVAAAVDLNANFESEADGARVKITAAAKGDAVDIGAGDSGFSVSKPTDGFTEFVLPGDSPSSIDNDPSA